VLINNAGIVRDAQLVKKNGAGPMKSMLEESWDAVIDVNLKGVFLVTRAVVPHMIRKGGGVILSATSVVALERKLWADKLRGLESGCNRHDAHVGARIRQTQHSRQLCRPWLYRYGHVEIHASGHSGQYSVAYAGGPCWNSRGRCQRAFLAGLRPSQLCAWDDFVCRRWRIDRDLDVLFLLCTHFKGIEGSLTPK